MNFLYPSLGNRQTEDCVIWLLGSCYVVMMEATERGQVLGEQEMRGNLRQKYAAYKMIRMIPLNLNNL